MKKFMTNKSMLCLSLLAILTAIQVNISAFASEHEAACKEHIQGKIAWDPTSNYTSAAQWDERNLSYLCQGTSSPKAPGECFHHVMTGHVSYGASDKWEYKNAIELCKGSDNAEATISCFSGKIKDNVDWKTAISQCQAKK